MKFGPVPLAQAQGAILAHSIQLAEGRLRKGMTLEAHHVTALQNAGLDRVTVAQLEQGDKHEDAAADALAQALVPDPEAAGLKLSKAFTGRVNITAAGPGVVSLNQRALVAMNAIDPMITLATVPPYQQMAEGGMVGTVKVISYGVSARDVDKACTVAKGALRLRAPIYKTAALIVTDIPGGAGLKGEAAIADRITALGMQLGDTQLVPHDEVALSRAIAQAQADIVLILTASATSDAYDVAPQALRLAGGQVERFGMPVDPGNLLFLGRIDARPVIGLPGCARSPALNGADWVLSRVACGVEVTGQDIAEMGVGGLLKEIPTRPMPRRSRPKSG